MFKTCYFSDQPTTFRGARDSFHGISVFVAFLVSNTSHCGFFKERVLCIGHCLLMMVRLAKHAAYEHSTVA